MANMCTQLKVATYFCCNDSKNFENIKSYNYFANSMLFLNKLEFKLIEENIKNIKSTFNKWSFQHHS